MTVYVNIVGFARTDGESTHLDALRSGCKNAGAVPRDVSRDGMSPRELTHRMIHGGSGSMSVDDVPHAFWCVGASPADGEWPEEQHGTFATSEKVGEIVASVGAMVTKDIEENAVLNFVVFQGGGPGHRELAEATETFLKSEGFAVALDNSGWEIPKAGGGVHSDLNDTCLFWQVTTPDDRGFYLYPNPHEEPNRALYETQAILVEDENTALNLLRKLLPKDYPTPIEPDNPGWTQTLPEVPGDEEDGEDTASGGEEDGEDTTSGDEDGDGGGVPGGGHGDEDEVPDGEDGGEVLGGGDEDAVIPDIPTEPVEDETYVITAGFADDLLAAIDKVAEMGGHLKQFIARQERG